MVRGTVPSGAEHGTAGDYRPAADAGREPPRERRL